MLHLEETYVRVSIGDIRFTLKLHLAAKSTSGSF
jgi:hypothetical protein